MKHYYFLLLALFAIIFTNSSLSQTYVSDTTFKQTITAYNQSFTFSFTGLPAGGYGTGTLVVYFEGDFGDSGEYATVQDESSTNIGQSGPYSSNFDCAPRDSAYIPFNAANIDALWSGDAQVDFTLTISSNVDLGVCSVNYLQCRIIYDYCAAGTPQEFASFSLSDSTFCTYDSPLSLVGTPANGTFSGNGIIGNTFNPINLAPGSTHIITYEATDMIGCTTSYSKSVKVLRAPNAPNTTACPGEQPELMALNGGEQVWFYDMGLSQVIDTANTVYPDPIYTTTSYYVANLNTTSSFLVNNIDVLDSMVVDHNATTGDDRGGIAITQDYLFVVGDNNTVRSSALDLSGQVSLPIQDALFSNLNDGNLYTLWNSTSNTSPNYNTSAMEVNAIRGLDINMALTAEVNQLSSPIPVDYGSIIFAGYGFVGIYSGDDNHVYIVDLDDYTVTDLGSHTGINNYGTENWSAWGVLEFDGSDFHGLFRSYSGSGNEIVRRNFTTGVESTVYNFTNGISDLSSFTVSPWNDRWYFHYEGSSTTFGGSSETMGYANALMSSTILAVNELGCYTEVEVVVNEINLGNDTTICENHTPFVLFAGLGFNSYTWNGDNNNYNAFPVTTSGTYILEAVDGNNCTIVDTIQILLDPCAGINELENILSSNLYPNPTNGNTTLTLNSEIADTYIIRILEMNGKIIETNTVQVLSGENEFQINSSNLINGVYMLSITDSNLTSKVVRFVKQ